MSRAKDGERPLIDQAVAGNSPVCGHHAFEDPVIRNRSPRSNSLKTDGSRCEDVGSDDSLVWALVMP